jgi:hypothetical protein
MSGRLLQPPEIVEVDEKVIFLAGPIQGAPDWQTQAIEIIHTLDSGIVVASPRKEYEEGTFVYERQVDWETHYLETAARLGAIAFWLAEQVNDTPGRAYAQTSRFELGEWKTRHAQGGINLVVGIEVGFGNAKYIHRRFSQDCPYVPILDSLENTMAEAVKLVQKK